MNRPRTRTLRSLFRNAPSGLAAGLWLAGLWLAGCGVAVQPRGDGGAEDSGGADGGLFCDLPNGGRCPAGTRCPAGDGCNTCACPAGGGSAQCTLLGCPPPMDAGGPVCRSARDCAAGFECAFSESSCATGAVGVCMPVTPCAAAVPYCDCERNTYEACRPNRPTAHRGACDMPPVGCNGTRACPPDRECIYPVGACGVDGRCEILTDCAAIADFCGCDGASFRACPNRPNRPAASAGACGGRDAGVDAGQCAGARLDAARARCTDAAGSTLPVQCCTGWNCDLLGTPALCEILPGPCPAGEARTVTGSCYGPCVPSRNCQPFNCTRGMCPERFVCGASGVCAPN